MEEYVIETKSGSLYKVMREKFGWYIFLKGKPLEIKSYGPTVVEVTEITKLKNVLEFKGNQILFESTPKSRSTGRTSAVKEVYSKI